MLLRHFAGETWRLVVQSQAIARCEVEKCLTKLTRQTYVSIVLQKKKKKSISLESKDYDHKSVIVAYFVFPSGKY